MVNARKSEKNVSEHLIIENQIATRVLLTAKQMASLLAVNENQLYKLVRSGKIPAVKLGRALRFQWDEVIDKTRSQSCPI